MKKTAVVLAVILALCLTACSAAKQPITDAPEAEGEGTVETAPATEETEKMDAQNRTLIAQALDIPEDARNLKFILNGLNTIEAGSLQSAVYSSENGEDVLDIVSQDGTNYRIYLNSSGSVDAIMNVDTGEWPVSSQR